MLAHGAWVDLRPRWMAGADVLFERLRARRARGAPSGEPMYDRVVDVPRLLCFYDEDDPLPDPILARATGAGRALRAELGEPFGTAGLCLYRDGATAWPGTATGSAVAAPTTPWSRSSPSATRAPLLLRPARGRRRRCGIRSATATCS